MVNNYKAFDVILVNCGKIEFDGEQGGVRPAIIIQNELGNIHSPCTIVIPITSKIKHINQPTHSFFGKKTLCCLENALDKYPKKGLLKN